MNAKFIIKFSILLFIAHTIHTSQMTHEVQEQMTQNRLDSINTYYDILNYKISFENDTICYYYNLIDNPLISKR